MDFLKYILIKISHEYSGPIWLIGHLHLSLNWTHYENWHLIMSSSIMTIFVVAGIWLEYVEQKVNKDK